MVGNDRSASLANAMIAFRRTRAQILPAELFGEPAWDLLLQLYVADARGLRLTGADVCRNSNVPPGAMSRWLRLLSERGLLVGDGSGDLTDELTLSGEGMTLMEKTLASATDLQITLELS